MIDITKVTDCALEDVRHDDQPDYCDAYIASADIEISREEYNLAVGINQTICNGHFFRELNDAELQWLNEQRDFVYAQLEKWLH